MRFRERSRCAVICDHNFAVLQLMVQPAECIVSHGTDLSKTLGTSLLKNVHPDGVTPYRVGGGNGGMGCHTLAESGALGPSRICNYW